MNDTLTIKFPYTHNDIIIGALEKALSCGEIDDDAAIKILKRIFFWKNIIITGNEGEKYILHV